MTPERTRRARVVAADMLASHRPHRGTKSSYALFAGARDQAARACAGVLSGALKPSAYRAALPYADAAELLDALAVRSLSWRSR